jgi:hypothetical protein
MRLHETIASSELRHAHPFTMAVIPAFNEERFIGTVVLTARYIVDRVIVISDGSTDRTADVARRAGAEVIELERNMGKGEALNVGFASALSHEPDVVVMLDGDSQHDANDIPKLVLPIVTGDADIVVGSRFMGSMHRVPRWRVAGQRILNGATNAGSGVSLTDSQSGFRAFSPRALTAVRFKQPGLAAESEMQFIADRLGLRMEEVPISVHYLDGNKRNPFSHGLEVVDSILTLVARRRPLAFLGVPGAASVVTGATLGVWVVETVNTHHVVPIGTAILTSMLITIGLVLLLIAVVLNTLDSVMSRIRDEVNEALKEFDGPVSARDSSSAAERPAAVIRELPRAVGPH